MLDLQALESVTTDKDCMEFGVRGSGWSNALRCYPSIYVSHFDLLPFNMETRWQL
jgi:hypothetical protein